MDDGVAIEVIHGALTSLNSLWAFFGRSPPRIVITRRMM
jgi:hypothetical protein